MQYIFKKEIFIEIFIVNIPFNTQLMVAVKEYRS